MRAAPGYADVSFAPDFTRRLERLVVAVAAARERREGAGGAALAGAGEEFIGYRPYRSGEDLRQLDWNLYARLDRPFVRMTRREAAEHWALHIDASASMAVGPPGKLQLACEVAAALASIGIRMRARVEIRFCGGAAASSVLTVRQERDLQALLGFLESQSAAGSSGLADGLALHRPRAEAGRVFLVGDFFDLPRSAVRQVMAKGRELFLVQILAPAELAPEEIFAPGESVEWLDPEQPGRRGERAAVRLDAATLGAYQRELDARLEAWGAYAARHGFRYDCSRSDRAFEDVVHGMLGA